MRHRLCAGKTTVNSLYGTRVAVLAGDFLFAQSSWYLANLDNLEVRLQPTVNTCIMQHTVSPNGYTCKLSRWYCCILHLLSGMRQVCSCLKSLVWHYFKPVNVHQGSSIHSKLQLLSNQSATAGLLCMQFQMIRRIAYCSYAHCATDAACNAPQPFLQVAAVTCR